MKAVVYSEYGGPDVLRVADIATPTPAAKEVLVQVRAAGLNPVDWHFYRGMPLAARLMTGFGRPRRQRGVGGDFAGTIAALGRDVHGFAVGQSVFGYASNSLAQYMTVATGKTSAMNPQAVAAKPERVTFEQAASVGLAGITGLQMLRDSARVKAGQRVLIIGAGGGIGSLAVQIAKSFGAHVTGVQSAAACDLVRSLGADRVIDYAKEDFTQDIARYDAIIDNVTNRELNDVLRTLKPDGTLVPNSGGTVESGFDVRRLIATLAKRPFLKQKIAMPATKLNHADMQLLANMMAAGTLKPVLERCYPLTAVAEAFRHLETGHAHGKIVVTI